MIIDHIVVVCHYIRTAAKIRIMICLELKINNERLVSLLFIFIVRNAVIGSNN